MKEFDATWGHPFEEPFITYHLQRAKVGNYESAQWLRDNVQEALKVGNPVEPHVLLSVRQMRKGGLRKSRRIKGQGKRGKGLGDHHQLLYAREMWKQIKLAKLTVEQAMGLVAEQFSRKEGGVRNAYYRFATTKNPAERRVFLVELKRDYIDCPGHWEALAKSPDVLKSELAVLGKKLPSF